MDQNEQQIANPADPNAGLLHDLATLSRTGLSRKYRAEYSSWRNRKSAAGSENWSPEFSDFKSFLSLMGPQPSAGFTLDRIDHRNPKYGPGLCRWADKKEQARNRPTTRVIFDEGEYRRLPDVAEETGRSPDRLHRTLQKSEPFGRHPRAFVPWPYPGDKERQAFWEQMFLNAGGLREYESRFDFLIPRLQRRKGDLANWLIAQEPPKTDADTLKYKQEQERYDRCHAFLLHSLEQHVEWKMAWARFQATDHEARIVSGRKNSAFWETD